MKRTIFAVLFTIIVLQFYCTPYQLSQKLNRNRHSEIFSRFNVLTQQTKLYVDSIETKIGRDSAISLFGNEAWGSMQVGDKNDAIIRFNRILCLDTNNANPYWGYGLILSSNCEPDSAISFLEIANGLDTLNIRIKYDLLYLKVVRLSNEIESPDKSAKLNEIILEYSKYQPDFNGTPTINCQYAEVLACLKDFTGAFAQLKIAKSKGVDIRNANKIVEYIKSGKSLYSYICN